MTYKAKNYDHLIGMTGFSDALLKSHFKLYEGYVAEVNKLIELLADPSKAGQERDDIKRRFPWEFNGMRLHEAYFGNLAKQGKGLDPKSDLAVQIVRSFGSIESWEKDFRSVSSMRGIGWAVLAWDPEGKDLFNIWINEHDVGHLYYSTPLLVNDVFEHAYIADYGIKRADYIDAFMKVIDWPAVRERFPSVAPVKSGRP